MEEGLLFRPCGVRTLLFSLDIILQLLIVDDEGRDGTGEGQARAGGRDFAPPTLGDEDRGCRV